MTWPYRMLLRAATKLVRLMQPVAGRWKVLSFVDIYYEWVIARVLCGVVLILFVLVLSVLSRFLGKDDR